jgi:hypothetical protein
MSHDIIHSFHFIRIFIFIFHFSFFFFLLHQNISFAFPIPIPPKPKSTPTSLLTPVAGERPSCRSSCSRSLWSNRATRWTRGEGGAAPSPRAPLRATVAARGNRSSGALPSPPARAPSLRRRTRAPRSPRRQQQRAGSWTCREGLLSSPEGSPLSSETSAER